MADRAAALRGGTADAKAAAGRLTTPQWTDQREERGAAAKEKVTSVKRYWKGQAPQWAAGEEEDDAAPAAQRRRVAAPPEVVRRADDALALSARREVRAPEVVMRAREREPEPAQRAEEEQAEEEEEEDEDEIDRRRAAARARALQRREASPELEAGPAADEEEEEESEWETDTDDDDAPGRKMIKPLFVPKAERESLAERDAMLRAAEEEAEREAQRKAARALESRAAVAALLERDAAVAAAEEQATPSDVDTDDEAHEAEGYDAWQARELGRVARDRDEREAAFREKEELERLRAMTDEERAEWDRTHPPPVSEAQAARDNAKWAFMQKYYHKGAFFQSGPDDKFGTIGTFEIYKRDFGAATGEDKGYDRSMLPKAMQVRKGLFGRAGQVKWTHLSAEDTSRKKDDTWGVDPSLRAKASQRMAGANQPLSKPKHLAR